MFKELGVSGSTRLARKPKNTGAASAPVPRTVKTVRVDPDAWDRFVRYVRRRQGRGETVEVGELVEVVVKEFQQRHPA
jgi:hypothetical protein